MAIRPSTALSNGISYEKIEGQLTKRDYYKYAGNQGPFRPTGQGLAVNTPDFIAGAHNANAYLLNNGAGNPRDSYLKKTYLFVDSIETGWSVTGQTSQAQDARTWYPMNMHQDDIAILGMVANQNEYDKLVTFVQHSHFTARKGAEFSSDWARFVEFVMFQPPVRSYAYWPGKINVSVLLTSIKAGHQVFEFAKQFVLTAKVVVDHLDSNVDNLLTDVATRLDYIQIFGDYSSADLFTAGTTKDPPPRRGTNG